jgi:hypothetical protein
MCLVATHVYIIYRFYDLKLGIIKAFEEVHPRTNFLAVRELRISFIRELIFSAIFCPPGLDTEFEFKQIGTEATLSINDMITAWGFLRLYHLAKIYYERQITHRGIMVAKLCKFRPGFYYGCR